jgi:hypothetical protein
MNKVSAISIHKGSQKLGFKILLASAIGVFSIGLVTQSVLANLNASAFNVAPQAIDSGTLSLSVAPNAASAGFTTAIAKMIPGDTQYRYVNYTQGGTTTAYLPKLRLTSTLLDGTVPAVSSSTVNDNLPGAAYSVKQNPNGTVTFTVTPLRFSSTAPGHPAWVQWQRVAITVSNPSGSILKTYATNGLGLLGALNQAEGASYTYTTTVNELPAGSYGLFVSLNARSATNGGDLERAIGITPSPVAGNAGFDYLYKNRIKFTVGSQILTDDAVRGLQLTVNRCSVAWTVVAGTPGVGTCVGGTSSTVLTTTPLSAIQAADTALSSNFLLAAGDINYLQFVIFLPVGLDETVANGGTPVVTGSPLAISAVSASAGTVTYTLPSSAGLSAGQQIVISGAATAGYNGYKTIAAVPNGTTFTVIDSATGATSTATGTLGSVQGLTAAITWTVSETQRPATSTNG